MNVTIPVKLLEQDQDMFGYTTYVFFITDQDQRKHYKTDYFMCTRCPNWEMRDLQQGDEGYVEVQFNEAGRTTWWDGQKHVQHHNTFLQFINFVTKNTTNNQEIRL